MQALLEIRKCFPNVHKPRPIGEVRQFFIAAEEEVWDYAPTLPEDGSANGHGIFINCVQVEVVTHCNNVCAFLTLCRDAAEFVTGGRNRIGSRYKKVRYVEYTDDTFTVKMLRSPAERHLGILGKTNVAKSILV